VAQATKPDRLFFTESDEANRLLAEDPFALLIGLALDQQVAVQKAFSGPQSIKERVGTLDARTLARTDLEDAFRQKPAIHRFPGAMAQRVQELAQHVVDEYDGDAARLWEEAGDGADLRRRITALPGYGDMKIRTLAAILAKRFRVAAAQELVPSHPTLGDVDSPEALERYQAAKRAHKAKMRAAG
jgi:uncharacterized HhH-GPD family protein